MLFKVILTDSLGLVYMIGFKLWVYIHLFSTMFCKGGNFRDFLYAYLEDEVFPKWVYSYRKEFALMGANSFLHEMTPIYMGGNNENDRVASPESISSHLEFRYFRLILKAPNKNCIRRHLNILLLSFEENKG